MNKETCPIQRCYPDEKNRVIISCPHCSKSKMVDATPFTASNREMRIKCSCGRSFISIIEFRKCSRKKTQLRGDFVNKETGEKGEMIVCDLSRTGLGFTSISPHKLKTGDVVNVSFIMENANRDKIERTVRVLNIKGNRIGGEFQRFYPDDQNRITIICPHCSKSKTVDVTLFTASKREMITECSCGRSFVSVIEFRKCYRKKTQLGGDFVNKATGEKGEMLVWDLSMTGLGFTPISPHRLKTDDVVHVSFILDNVNRDKIERVVRLRNINGNRLGGEFLPNQPTNRALNFYLLP
jgi:hypothetical protein